MEISEYQVLSKIQVYVFSLYIFQLLCYVSELYRWNQNQILNSFQRSTLSPSQAFLF